MEKKYLDLIFFCFTKKSNHCNNTTNELNEKMKDERNCFFNMLLKMQHKRPHFNAKRVMKKLYPDYFF